MAYTLTMQSSLLLLLAALILSAAASTTEGEDEMFTTNKPTEDGAAAEPSPEAETEKKSHESETPITCYTCSSVLDGPYCHDPVDDEKLAQMNKTECNATNGEVSCFKVKTTEFKFARSNREEETVVITTRMCSSWEGGESDWSTDSGSESNVQRSFCTTDLCNSADVIATSAVTWLSGLLFCLVAMFRL